MNNVICSGCGHTTKPGLINEAGLCPVCQSSKVKKSRGAGKRDSSGKFKKKGSAGEGGTSSGEEEDSE